MDNDSFFLVQYRNGKATEIGIQRELSKVASIKLFGLDMFNTTAECIIDSLMKKDNVVCNEKDLQLGNGIYFSLKLESDFGESEHFIPNC